MAKAKRTLKEYFEYVGLDMEELDADSFNFVQMQIEDGVDFDDIEYYG